MDILNGRAQYYTGASMSEPSCRYVVQQRLFSVNGACMYCLGMNSAKCYISLALRTCPMKRRMCFIISMEPEYEFSQMHHMLHNHGMSAA